MTGVRRCAGAAGGVAVLDDGWRTTASAEHATLLWAAEHGVLPTLACTHFHQGRVVVTVTTVPVDPQTTGVATDGDADLQALRGAHVARTSGRAFVFRGQESSPASLTVGDLLDRTAVDDVVAVGGRAPERSETLCTNGFLRPQHVQGRLRLHVRPAVGGLLVPFEQRDPTPCCASH